MNTLAPSTGPRTMRVRRPVAMPAVTAEAHALIAIEHDTLQPVVPRFDDAALTVASLDSAALLRGHKVVQIEHNGFVYKLQATKLGKLILTK